MNAGPFERRRETLTSAVQAIVRDVGLDEAEASSQLVQAIQQKQMKIFFVARSTMSRSEFASIDWASIDTVASTIRWKPNDVMSRECLRGGRGIPTAIVISIDDRERLWPARVARPGPKPGRVDRYAESDRLLFSDIGKLHSEKHMSLTAAAKVVAERAEGGGTLDSRARRLRERYQREIDSH